MVNKKNATLLICLLYLLSFGSGCWDKREIENLAIVQALGLDLGPGNQGVNVTIIMPIPTKMNGERGSGGGENRTTYLISMEAPTIYEAFNRINTTLTREVTLIQNSTIIFGEALARKGIKKWVDNLSRFREMRRNLNLFVAKGTAAEIMSIKPVLEAHPGEYFNDLIQLTMRTGMYPKITLNDFLIRYEAFAQEDFLPLITKYKRQGPEAESKETAGGKGESSSGGGTAAGKSAAAEAQDGRIIGTAIFKRGKMVGAFDLYESQILQLLTGNFKEAFLSIPDPHQKNQTVVFRLIASSPVKIKYRRQGSKDRFQIKVNLEADIVSIQSAYNYATPNRQDLLGKLIAAELKQRIIKVIKKAQDDYESDVFGFGIKVRNTTLTSEAWDQYHWPEKFPAAQFKVAVVVKIRRVGMQFQPPELR